MSVLNSDVQMDQKQPGLQKFWKLCCHYKDIYDWIPPLNKRPGVRSCFWHLFLCISWMWQGRIQEWTGAIWTKAFWYKLHQTNMGYAGPPPLILFPSCAAPQHPGSQWHAPVAPRIDPPLWYMTQQKWPLCPQGLHPIVKHLCCATFCRRHQNVQGRQNVAEYKPLFKKSCARHCRENIGGWEPEGH